MDKKLARLFDFQRFSQNKNLQKLIDATESNYSLDDNSISDDTLDLIWAAGEIHVPVEEKDDDTI